MKALVATIVLILTLSTNATFASTSNSTSTNGITWIKVLIAEYEPPSGQDKNGKDRTQQYVDNIKNYAPNLEQFHVRVKGDSNAKTIASVASKLITAFGNKLKLGYHPDLSKGSYDSWGCNKGDTPCVMNKTIKKLNEIEEAVKSNNSQFTGFDIFSLEQSYIIDGYTDAGKKYNACFTKSAQAPCPTDTKKTTTKSMQIGNVLGHGSGTDNKIYAPNTLQWGYPQLYNLNPVNMILTDYNNFISKLNSINIKIDISSTFPTPLPSPDTPLFIVDGCLQTGCDNILSAQQKKYPKGILLPLPRNSAGSQSGYLQCHPGVAAIYLARTATDLYSETITAANTNGGIVWMLSGEPSFLGATCQWDVKQLNDFMTLLKKILVYQCNNNYPTSNCNTNKINSIKFGIWSFDTIPLFIVK